MEERRVAVVAHLPPSGSSEVSESDRALSGLAALGQPSRLQIFRLLMRHEPEGLQAKAISESVNMPHNTLSTHLAILARAGLVTGKRRGRLIIYRANIQGMRRLISFLVMDCCQGAPEVCCFSTEAASVPGPASAKGRKRTRGA
jgi:DNA-binding transcriptional ArsR family regulator